MPENEIERLMREQIAAEQAQALATETEQSKRLAESARFAATFIELMNKNGVEPEPIYTHQQITKGRRRSPVIIEQYQLVRRGWVISYSIDKFESPWLIHCLLDDGTAMECDVRPSTTPAGHKTQGLVAPPAREMFEHKVLCVQPSSEQGAPYFRKEDYATAAKRYLTQ
jgi:hypothetical protein